MDNQFMENQVVETQIIETQNIEKNSNKKGPYIIIVILCLLVLVLGGYIFYDKVIDKKETNDTKQTEQKKEEKKAPTEFIIDNGLVEQAVKISLIKNIAKDEDLGLWGYENSIWAEGHNVLRSEFKDNNIYAYVLAQVGSYTKQEDGTYQNTSGTSGPILIVLTKKYEFISYQVPTPGEGWNESLASIFPSDLIAQATGVDYRADFYQNQINTYLTE